MKRVYIFGAGGHAKVVCNILHLQQTYQVAGFVDEEPKTKKFYEHSLHRQGDLVLKRDDFVIVAIGDNSLRKKVADEIRAKTPEVLFATAIHPRAIVAEDVLVAEGTVIMAGAVVNPGSQVGRHCIVNTSSVVDHECVVGDYASVAPGAVLGGNVKVGSLSAIGLGAKIIHGISIGSKTVVGAGSLVLEDLQNEIVAYGSPAKKARNRSESERYL